MHLLKIKDFQKAYPFLYDKINEIRLNNNMRPISDEYTEHTEVPVDMQDASLADKHFDSGGPLGSHQAKKILDTAAQYPKLETWVDILYPNVKVKKPKNKRNKTMAKRRNVVEGELILFVEKDGDKFKCSDKDGKDYTDVVDNQKKMEYAFKNKGALRGRLLDDGSYRWRAVKLKFVQEKPQTIDQIEEKLAREENEVVS